MSLSLSLIFTLSDSSQRSKSLLRRPRYLASGIAIRCDSNARLIEPCLMHAVDVVPPRVVIEQAVDRQLQLVVQPVQQPPHAARRLAAAVREDAVVLLPELVLVEPLPDRVFFDVQDELGLALLRTGSLPARRSRECCSRRSPCASNRSRRRLSTSVMVPTIVAARSRRTGAALREGRRAALRRLR